MGKRLEHETWSEYVRRDPDSAAATLNGVHALIEENRRLVEIEESSIPDELDPDNFGDFENTRDLVRAVNKIIRYLKKSAPKQQI